MNNIPQKTTRLWRLLLGSSILFLGSQGCQGNELEAQGWIKQVYERERALDEIQVEYNNSGHQTILSSQKFNSVVTIKHQLITKPIIIKDPSMRYFDGTKIHKVSITSEEYVCPLHFFGIPDLEIEHRYTARKLHPLDYFSAILLEPHSENVDWGYYQLSPAETTILPSSCLYSDGRSFFLTCSLEEHWYPLDTVGLPSKRTSDLIVRYALKSETKMTMNTKDYQLQGTLPDFPEEGFYTLQGNTLQKLGGYQVPYSFRHKSSGATQALLPLQIILNPEQDINLFFNDLMHSSFLHPYITSICFPPQNLPTRNKGSFVSLVALTQRLPNLKRLELRGRNFLDDARELEKLIDPIGRNPSLQSLFLACQFNDSYIEDGIVALPLNAQENLLSFLPHFELFLKRLEIRNSKMLDYEMLSNIALGQLVSLDLEGCSQINEDCIRLLAGQNSGLEILNLSSTNIESFTAVTHTPLVFKNLQELKLNNINSLREINLESPRLTRLSMNNCPEINYLTLKGMALLEVLSCRNTKIQAKDLYEILQEKKGHIYLDISDCSEISGAHRKILETFSLEKAPEKLTLIEKPEIGDVHGQVLAFNRTLKNLTLRNTNIGKAGIQALGENRTLRSLCLDWLNKNVVDESTLFTLVRNLKGNQYLESLTLGFKEGSMSPSIQHLLNEDKDRKFKLTIL